MTKADVAACDDMATDAAEAYQRALSRIAADAGWPDTITDRLRNYVNLMSAEVRKVLAETKTED